MKQLKTAIIVDMMGSGYGEVAPEQEIEEIVERFSSLLAPAKLQHYRAWHPGELGKGIQPGTDLVLYDFGGMGAGSSLPESNARALLKWAENHPGSLVVIVSRFTFTRYVQPEMEEARGELPNVVCDFGVAGNIPEWFLNYAKGEG